MKKCTKCGEKKVLDDFYNQAKCSDGKTPECKLCWQKREEIKKKEREQWRKLYIG
jgi:hypothetical protein